MTNVIEQTSSQDNSGITALAIVLIACILMAVGVGFAYLNGFSLGPITVTENNTPIQQQTAVAPARRLPSLQGNNPPVNHAINL